MYIINYFLVENYLEKKTFLDWMKFTNFSLSSSIKKINLESLGSASAPIETIINDSAKTITCHRPF